VKKKTTTKKVGMTDSLLNVYVIQALAALIARVYALRKNGLDLKVCKSHQGVLCTCTAFKLNIVCDVKERGEFLIYMQEIHK